MIGAIRRPEWQGCPIFNATWESLRGHLADPRLSEADTDDLLGVARVLYDARVVRVSADQINVVDHALRADPGVFATNDWVQDFHLPFPRLFVELDGLYKEFAAGVVLWEEPEPCLGAIGIGVTARLDVGPRFVPEILVLTKSGNGHVRSLTESARRAAKHDEQRKQHRTPTSLTWGMEIAQCLVVLLSSANVDLEDEPVPRQQRRDAERRRRSIPLTIKVCRASGRSVPRGGTDPCSYSRDRAGHFAHYFEIAKSTGEPSKTFETWAKAKPDRVIEVNGVPCIRTWHPQTIVGDGIYVPKVRDARDLALT